MGRLFRRTCLLFLLAQVWACHGWRTEEVAPELVLAAREPERVRITEPGGATMVVLDPTVAGDTLHGRSEAGGYALAIPLADVLRLETRQGNVITSRVVVGAMALGVAGIVIACGVFTC